MTPPLNPYGVLCPTPDCPGNGAVGDLSIHSRRECRFRCRRCGHTFAATTGTPFYRVHHAAALMTIVLALLAHGCPVQAIVFAYGLHEDTVRAWLERGGVHAQRIHAHLVQAGQVEEVHVQADELWVRLRRGRVWQALALAVTSRLWRAGQISVTRDHALIDTLVRQVRRSLVHGHVLVWVDGLARYVRACQHVFFARTQDLGAGLWRLALPRGFLLGQVIQERRRYKLVSVTRRAVVGTLEQITAPAHHRNGDGDPRGVQRAAEQHLPLLLGAPGAPLAEPGGSGGDAGGRHVPGGDGLPFLSVARQCAGPAPRRSAAVAGADAGHGSWPDRPPLEHG